MFSPQQVLYLVSIWDLCHQQNVILHSSYVVSITDTVVAFFAAAMMSSIYEEHKEEDGFLYFTYSGENTFGDLHVY
jgi:hypothetical protein